MAHAGQGLDPRKNIMYGPSIDWSSFPNLPDQVKVGIMTSLQGVTTEFREYVWRKASSGHEITRHDLCQFGIERQYWYQFTNYYVDNSEPRYFETWEFPSEYQYEQESVLRGIARSPAKSRVEAGDQGQDQEGLINRPNTRSQNRQQQNQLGLDELGLGIQGEGNVSDPTLETPGTSTPRINVEYQDRLPEPTQPRLPLGPPHLPGYQLESLREHMQQIVGSQYKDVSESVSVVTEAVKVLERDNKAQSDALARVIKNQEFLQDCMNKIMLGTGIVSAVNPTNVIEGASANAAGEAAGRADAVPQMGRRTDAEAAMPAGAESQTGRRAADPAAGGAAASGTAQPPAEVKSAPTESAVGGTASVKTPTSGMVRNTQSEPNHPTHPGAPTPKQPLRSILTHRPETQTIITTEQNLRQEQNEENVEVIEEIYNPHVDLPALEDPRTVRLPQKKRVAFGGAGARSAQPVWASYVGGRRNPTAHWEPTTLAHQTVTQGYNYFNPAGYQEQMGSYPYTNMHQVKVEGMGAVMPGPTIAPTHHAGPGTPFPTTTPHHGGIGPAGPTAASPHHGGAGTPFHMGTPLHYSGAGLAAPTHHGGSGMPLPTGTPLHHGGSGNPFQHGHVPYGGMPYHHQAGTGFQTPNMGTPISRFETVGQGPFGPQYPGGPWGRHMEGFGYNPSYGWPAAKMSKGNLDPPEYDGRANFRFWLSRFEDFLVEMRIPEHQYKQYLLNAITKGCKKHEGNFIMKEFMRHTPTAHLTYVDLVRAISYTLQEDSTDAHAHRRLYTAAQKSGESIKDWHKRVHDMFLETLESCTTRGDEAAKKQIFMAARTQFISKLIDPEIRVHMESNPNPPDNFNKLLSWATHVEESVAHARAKKPVTPFLGAVYPEESPTVCAVKTGEEEGDESKLIKTLVKVLQKANTEGSGGGYYNPRGRGQRGGFRGNFRGGRGRGGNRGSEGGSTERRSDEGATATESENQNQNQNVKDKPKSSVETRQEQAATRPEN